MPIVLLGIWGGIDKCMHTLLLNALDLIKRQKAEIEEKSNKLREVLPIVAEIKAEAIKEFAERLRQVFWSKTECDILIRRSVDNIVKEMVGDV